MPGIGGTGGYGDTSDEWSSIVFEHWRENHGDLLPYAPEKRRVAFRQRLGIELTNIWIMNIRATK